MQKSLHFITGYGFGVTQDSSLQQYAGTPKQKQAGGYTERDVKPETDLTEPQGKLKICNGGRIYGKDVKPETDLTEPQGKLKQRFHGRYIHSLKVGANPSY